MAKHKKKQFKPTPDSKDSEKSDLPPIESDKTPPTESENTPQNVDSLPPKKPEISLEEIGVGRRLKKLFWFRIFLAISAGAAATYIFEPIEGEERRWASIGFMIGIFIVSIVIAKGMRINLPPSKSKKIILEGLGSFVFLYLFTWILTFTFANLPPDAGVIPSPFTEFN